MASTEVNAHLQKLTIEQYTSDMYHPGDTTLRIKFIVFTTTKPLGCEDEEMFRTERDLSCLQTGLFEKFKTSDNDVEVKPDLSVEDFNKYIEDLKREKSLKKYNCFFFIFLTFITRNQLHFADDVLDIDKIVDSIQTSPNMVAWPKVFLIQADDISLIERPLAPPKEEVRKIPTDADRLIVISTVPGLFASHMPGTEGNKYTGCSFLIQAFLTALEENAAREGDNKHDVLTLTVDVNSKFGALLSNLASVLATGNADTLPLPMTTSTLRKLLYL